MSFRDLRDARHSRRRDLNLSSFAKPQSAIYRNALACGDDEDGHGPLSNDQQFINAPATLPDPPEQDVTMHNVPDEPPTASPLIRDDLYIELPDSISMRRSEKRGRGLWAKKPIKAGTVIFSTKPHVHVLSRGQLESYCTACASPRSETSSLKACTKCRIARYCDPVCQSADWPSHKAECDAMVRWIKAISDEKQIQEPFGPQEEGDDEITDNQVPPKSAVVPSEAIRCLGRIICRRKKEGNSKWRREIDAMQSHRDSVNPSMIDSHVQLAHAIVRYLGIDGPQDLEKYLIHGINELVDLISKFTTNSFTLADPSLTPLGVCVSPVAALINHSCDPNVAVVFPHPNPSALPNRLKGSKGPIEPVLQAVAIQDIPAGDELLTSYVDITLPASVRQKDLQETYNFTCACSACMAVKTSGSSSQYVDLREAKWCPKTCGGVCRLPTTDDEFVRCTKCGAPATDSESILDAVRVSQEALDKVSSLQFIDPNRALRLTENVIPLLSGAGLVPGAHPLLALARLKQSLLIERLPSVLKSAEQDKNGSQTFLDNTIRSAASVTFGLTNILRRGHPIRAIALAELGKLLAVDEPSPAPLVAPSSRLILPSYEQPNQDGRFPPSGPARLKFAMQTLHDAFTDLRIAFGSVNEGGETGITVHDTLINLEKEMGIWNKGIREALDDALDEQKGKGA